uniref:Uncharacterized protein n=1 Tax=Setaria viridis TaxID=4556 RepID=A0A4U6W326_SETVI|nr:hypothetical protein SEVIR_1G008900v2 [Setaria viridis]
MPCRILVHLHEHRWLTDADEVELIVEDTSHQHQTRQPPRGRGLQASGVVKITNVPAPLTSLTTLCTMLRPQCRLGEGDFKCIGLLVHRESTDFSSPSFLPSFLASVLRFAKQKNWCCRPPDAPSTAARRGRAAPLSGTVARPSPPPLPLDGAGPRHRPTLPLARHPLHYRTVCRALAIGPSKVAPRRGLATTTAPCRGPTTAAPRRGPDTIAAERMRLMGRRPRRARAKEERGRGGEKREERGRGGEKREEDDTWVHLRWVK